MTTREEAAAAHLVERLAGREGADHPRQVVCRWLAQHGHEEDVGSRRCLREGD